MDVADAIEKRRSIRAYKEYGMRKGEIERLMRAAQLAPSAKNLQPCRFIIVQDEKRKGKVAGACNGQMFMAKASIIACGVVDEKVSRWATIDLAIAMEHIALQATEMGFGTCWIGAFDEAAVKEVLKVPAHFRVVAMMPVGKAAEEPERNARKGLKEIVCWEEFGKN